MRINAHGDIVHPGDASYGYADEYKSMYLDRIDDEQRTVDMDNALRLRPLNPMPSEQYHADYSAWSRGMIADFLDRRSICCAKYITRTAPPDKVTAAMELGDLAHAALLEPHRLATDYVAYPATVLGKNGRLGTNAADDFLAEQTASGRVVLRQQKFDTVAAMVASVQASEIGQWISQPDAIREHVGYWTDGELTLRCKPDLVIVRDQVWCIDIKTTPDASPHVFKKRIEDGNLWLQDAHYSEGLRQLYGKDVRFIFAVVEVTWPYTCAVYRIEDEQRNMAYAKWRQAVSDIQACIETGVWQDAWEREINTVELSKWVLG